MPRIKETFAVVGLSNFGYRTAVSLYEAGAEVIAVDEDEQRVRKIAENVTRAVTANAMDWEVMEHVGVFAVGTVVLGLGSAFDVAVLLTHHLRKSTGVKRIVAQVDTEEKAEALQILGVDTVVFPERDMAERIVRRLTTPDLVEHVALSSDASIVEIVVPQEFVGRSLVDLRLRARFNVHVIGIKHPGEGSAPPDVAIAPSPETRFRAGETMILLGTVANLERFREAVRRGS